MRKSLLLILVLLLTVLCACALADTEYALEPCAGKISLNETNYIVLTPDNLDDHQDLLSSPAINKSKEDLLADWETNHVLLQAWTKKMDACLEVRVYVDEDSTHYYDLEQQTRQVRNEYLKLHQGSGKYAQDGFTILKPEWKKQKYGGNFLKFEYKRTVGDSTWRGVARKSIRNGYTVFLDYKVFDRLPRRTDEDNLNKIANTLVFEVKDASEAVIQSSVPVDPDSTNAVSVDLSGVIQVTVAPPLKTNSGVFTVEGHATPGISIVGVAMRLSNFSSERFPIEVPKSCNFKLKFTLPDEGVWNITLTMEINGVAIADTYCFDNVTQYYKSILPVTMTSEIPETLTSDELTVSGVTDKGVTVQCLVSCGGATILEKTIRTNGTGVFKFKVPTEQEGTYDIVLAFQKKGLDNSRLDFHPVRQLTEQDTKTRSATKAIHPAYNALVKKLDTYKDKYMVYDAHILSVDQAGDEWIIHAALKKNKDKYSNDLIYIADHDPGLEAGTKVKIYGTCQGVGYQIQSEEDIVSYPAFTFSFYE